MATIEPQLGEKIAEGRTAEIFSLDGDKVVKLFRSWVGKEDVQLEATATSVAQQCGFDAPAIGEFVSIEDRNGFIMERVTGLPVAELLQSNPRKFRRFAREIAALHLKMHSVENPNLPQQRDRYFERVKQAPLISEELKSNLLSNLDSLPSGNRLCHGDLHPNNIIASPNGLIAIDWIDASIGNPLAYVARSTLLITLSELSGAMLLRRKMIAMMRNRFHHYYLEAYFAQQPQARREYQQWLPIVAAARLVEGIENGQKMLVDAITKWTAK